MVATQVSKGARPGAPGTVKQTIGSQSVVMPEDFHCSSRRKELLPDSALLCLASPLPADGPEPRSRKARGLGHRLCLTSMWSPPSCPPVECKYKQNRHLLVLTKCLRGLVRFNRSEARRALPSSGVQACSHTSADARVYTVYNLSCASNNLSIG